MKRTLLPLLLLLAGSILPGCIRMETPPNIKTTSGKQYKVVSHRGGYKESGAPECSLAGLRYSASIGCYAAECDIVATSDGHALICHPDGSGKVNGMVPYEHTLSEIRAAGRLSNQEKIPTIEDFLDYLMDEGRNPDKMKIWIDCKAYSADNYKFTMDAIEYAYQVIEARGAYDFCEFMCPAGDAIFEQFRQTRMYRENKVNVAWMSGVHPSKFDKAWAQLRYDVVFPTSEGKTTTYTPETYLDAGMPLSIYCCTDAYDDFFIEHAVPYYPQVKALFTNYPNKLIKAIEAAGY